MEYWKRISLFGDAYEVSNLGRIRGWYYGGNKRNEPRIKKPQKNKNGYLYVILYLNKKPKAFTIHRLVLSVFDKPMPKNIDCCHKDGNRENNGLHNLKWGSRKENEADKRIHGSIAVGEKNGVSIMKETEIIEIRRLYKAGESTHTIAKKYNCSQQNIWHIVKYKTWKHI